MVCRSAVCAVMCLAPMIFVGCVAPPPSAQPERDAPAALGLETGEAIVIRVDAMADDAPIPAASMTLGEVVRRTAQNSPSIQAAMARVRVAQADAGQARLLPNPVMNLAVRFPESGTAIIDAGLSADLLAILRRPGTVRAADARLRAGSAEAVTVVLDEVTAAQELFFSIQSLEASLEVLHERSELLDRLLSLSESRLRIGEGTRLDVLTIQTQRVQLEAEIAENELQLRDARLALARLIGQPASAADWTVPKWAPPTVAIPDERNCVRVALERRPEVQQRTWEVEALGVERRMASSWPFKDVTGGIDAERDGDWSVGPAVSLPIPLLDQGQARRDRAAAALTEAMHQLTQSRRQVIEDVRRAHSSLTLTSQNLQRVRDQLLPLLEDRLRQAEGQFRAGKTDITALLIAEQELRASRAQLVELERRLSFARVRLERSAGGAGALAAAATQPTPSTRGVR